MKSRRSVRETLRRERATQKGLVGFFLTYKIRTTEALKVKTRNVRTGGKGRGD